jgi:hypothetical protein
MESNRLATFFDKQREIIEAAETPFAKLAIFILPILAPIVPASLTGLHLFKLFLEVFSFKYAENFSVILSLIISLVLELLGYVGAISFIQAIFRLIKTGNSLYMLPAILNGLAYVFYLILMFLVNYMLGKYFNTPDIINTIVGLLSFVTVPTGLLAANYLSQKEIKEDEKEVRKERREERLEKLRIRSGKLPNNLPESYQKEEKLTSNLPTDWRKIRPSLSHEQVTFIASNEPKDIVKALAESGFAITPRTASNWRVYAATELGITLKEN